MSGNSNGLVQKLWNYCNILRDDGLSYGDYVEQFDPTVAGLFLKPLGDERCNR
jgi:type I restriction enzyme M protein